MPEDQYDEQDDGQDAHVDAWVRDLLADAAVDPVPLPVDVAASLDARLDDLATERERDGTVVPIAAARRRRWSRVLLAAAAVTVGGFALTTTFDDLGGGDATTMEDTTAGSAADESAGGAREGLGSPGASEQDSLVAVRSDHLRADVRRAVSAPRPLPAPLTGGKTAGAPAGADTEGSDAARRPCADPPLPRSLRRIPAAYDGAPATLVVRPVGAGRVRVSVWSCSGEALRVVSVRR